MIKSIFAVALLSGWAGTALAADDASAQARTPVGRSRGLIVHVGCGDGALTSVLRLDETCLVHGIDRDPANIAKAREHIRSLDLYGPGNRPAS